MIKENNSIWREDSNFSRFKVKFHAKIVGFCATIKFGEKLRFFEKCAELAKVNTFVIEIQLKCKRRRKIGGLRAVFTLRALVQIYVKKSLIAS